MRICTYHERKGRLMKESLILELEDATTPDIFCANCMGRGDVTKADLFIALGIHSDKDDGVQSCMYVPFCFGCVDIPRSRIPPGHMANDMPDLLI